ncbi:nucleotidyltransferase family protein [Pseudanabaena sp. FACHB-2040]|uniref:nucleotidyltransferase family protein n=1 Tax=Pseudanabaena sp. FACHB-2040 TaxID=2692859 RepID=UPI001682C477|nr:nucleotidyltransferase family protein [Pseudanabaena sp. FACHB-2040]MBD2258442.1 nucleotidyltransferase family protein [Pseudanabaena sp. FACHB-2040]
MISLPILWPQDKISAFCDRWSVAELSLFGSVLRDDFHNHSDIDLLIAFSPDADWSLFDHIRMQQELEAILQRKVDLVSKRAIERSQNPIRRHEILSTAQVIYTRGAYAPK